MGRRPGNGNFKSAVQLGNPDAGHALSFSLIMRVAVVTVEAQCRYGKAIDIKLQSVPEFSLTRALASHDHEKLLNFPSADISPSVAIFLD
jgi:hypothetical protein